MKHEKNLRAGFRREKRQNGGADGSDVIFHAWVSGGEGARARESAGMRFVAVVVEEAPNGVINGGTYPEARDEEDGQERRHFLSSFRVFVRER